MKIIKTVLSRKARLTVLVVIAAILFPILQAAPASAGWNDNGQQLDIHVYHHRTNWGKAEPKYVEVCGTNNYGQWACHTWGLTKQPSNPGDWAIDYTAKTYGWYFYSIYWGPGVHFKLFDSNWRDIGWSERYVAKWREPTQWERFERVNPYTYEWYPR